MEQDNSKIYIIDDDSSLSSSLRWLFESVSLTVKTFSNPKEFLETFNPKEQGCLLVDVRMPYMSGLELIEMLQAKKTALCIIVMTAYGDIPMAIRAMKSGAYDFILKPFNDQLLLETVQLCLKKSQKVVVNDEFWENFKTLSLREQQILKLISEGKLNKEIAYILNIAISTVEAHRAKIMQKMKVKTLAELLKLCFQFEVDSVITI